MKVVCKRECGALKLKRDLMNRTVVASFALLASLSSAVAGSVDVDYQVTKSWRSGFKASVTLKNNGSSAVNGWSLAFDLPVTVKSAWNVVIDSANSTNTRKAFKNGAYNGAIEPGSSVSFGFVGQGDSALTPKNIVVNGDSPDGDDDGGGDDSDDRVTSSLKISAHSVNEGSNSHTINLPVSLSPAATSSVTVKWATQAGTATAGTDFKPANGTLSFSAGQTSKNISLTIYGDAVEENDETFDVKLSDASGATIQTARATITLKDDDENDQNDDGNDDDDGHDAGYGYATPKGQAFNIQSSNRALAADSIHDWSKAGYRGNGALPSASKRTHVINAVNYGVNANDGKDDSVALQNAIDSAANLTRDYNHFAVIQLPAGTINLSKQINLHLNYVVIKGKGSNPENSRSLTKLLFRPDEDTRYDKLLTYADGTIPDFDAMSTSGGDLDWVWPGRGLLKVQTLDVHSGYSSNYANAPANRKDIFEGSVNFHWKAGLSVLQNGGLVAAAGSKVISLDGSIASRKLNVLKVGSYVVVKGADTKKMYQEQGVDPSKYKDLFMKMQMFKLAAVDLNNRTITLDKPLEFDLYANSIADGSPKISKSNRYSRVVPVTVVEGIGIEDVMITQPLSGMPAYNGGIYNLKPSDAVGKYRNLAPEYALHGIVFKWAANCWVSNVRTFMTGSHAIVTEEAKNIQIENSVFQGAWNKGAGGNGYFRCSRLWDGLIHNNTLQDLRHITMQWSASGNVVIGNHLDCDVNFHGGWERYNLIEQNTSRVPVSHAPKAGESWYPIWWATGPKAGKWSGSSGPRNVLFNNDMSKQSSVGGAFKPYTAYTTESSEPHRIIQMGWDRDTHEGSHWLPLRNANGTMLNDWSGSESVDFSKAPYSGVNSEMSVNKTSLFLKTKMSNYFWWALNAF